MARRVVAIVSDLFFVTKIAATAEAADVPLETWDLPAAQARLVSQPVTHAGEDSPAIEEAPSLFILDLSAGEPALALARSLRAAPATAAIPIVAFYSHVEQA